MTERLIGYCGGKLTGSGAEATALYFQLRDGLEGYGVDLYLPLEHTGPGTGSMHPLNSTAENVCALDVFRVGFADFMLAALDKPSTGTGMELIIGQDRLVPVFAFYHQDLELEKDVS